MSRCVQRGVDLPSLDVTYFTSLSYYILLLFGLRGVFMLFFRENTIDETQMYRQQMGMGGGANPMAAMAGGDPTKSLETERAALDMVRCCVYSPPQNPQLVCRENGLKLLAAHASTPTDSLSFMRM